MAPPACELCKRVNKVTCKPREGFTIPIINMTIGTGRTMYQNGELMGELNQVIQDCPVVRKKVAPANFWSKGGGYIENGKLHMLNTRSIIYEVTRRQ